MWPAVSFCEATRVPFSVFDFTVAPWIMNRPGGYCFLSPFLGARQHGAETGVPLELQLLSRLKQEDSTLRTVLGSLERSV